MPAKQRVWLNNMNGLFPEQGKTREQNEAETVKLGEHRSFHLSMEDDQLLAEYSIFYNKIEATAIQV